MTTSGGEDLLSLAARALREEADRDRSVGAVEAWEGMHGWRDVSKDIRRAARRRRIALVVTLQLLVAVVGVGAWAAASGRLPVSLFRSAPASASGVGALRPAASGRHWLAAAPAPPPVAPPGAASEAAPAVASSPVPRLDSTTARAPVSTPTSAVAAAREPRFAAAPPAAKPAAPAPVSVPEVRPDPDEIYRQAHRAHFVLRDPAAALALWDRYLAAGGGSLTLEARYNRAIALVRLHRREEAIGALAPFAAGAYAGYRQEEAQALLRMLGVP